jgi:hypothetical protein
MVAGSRRRTGRHGFLPMVGILAVSPLVGCGDPQGGEYGAPPSGSGTGVGGASAARVTLVFSRGEASAEVTRALDTPEPGPEEVLQALLAGPTPGERAEGIGSWFSEATGGALRSAVLGADGLLVVDFHDLRTLIPNASASAGSAMLLRELNGTLFALPGVRSIEYRMEGSCDIFWNWLQYECRIETRPPA